MHFVRVQCAMHTRWWCCKIVHKPDPNAVGWLKNTKKIPWESFLCSLSFTNFPRKQTDCYMMIFISVPLNRMHKIVARHLIFVNSFFPSFSEKINLYVFPSLKRCNSCLLGLFVDTRLCIFIYTPLWCFSSVYFRLILCILHSWYFFPNLCVFFSRFEFLYHSFYNVQRDFLYLKTPFIAYHQVRSSSCMYGIKCGACCFAIAESVCVYFRLCLWSSFWVIQQFSHFICSFLFQFPVLSMSPAWDTVTIILWSCTGIFNIFGCEQILLLSGILEQHNLEC